MDALFPHHRSYLPSSGYSSASAAFDPSPFLLPSLDPFHSAPSLHRCDLIGPPVHIPWPPLLPHQPPPQILRSQLPGRDAGRPIRPPTVAQSLGPRKKVLKQTRGGNAVPKRVQAAMKDDLKVKAKEEALAKEVRELHALWRNAGKQEKSQPQNNESVADGKLLSNDSKKAKQERKKKGLRKKKNQAMIGQADEKPQVPEPIDEGKNWTNIQHLALDSEGDSAWGGTDQNGKVEIFPMTQEEKQLELQRKACKNVIKFIGSSQDSEESDEEDLSDSDDEDEQTSAGVKAREDKSFDFFLGLFEDNQELRKLYVDNCNVGKFECMVCTCVGGKAIKQFGDLSGLVMHALKILNTKKRAEHRGYGRAVCFVLGWDPLRNPAMPKVQDLRPRGCIPPCDDALDEAICEENKGFEGIIQIDKGLTDVKVDNGDDMKLAYKGADELLEEEGQELQVHLAVTLTTEALMGEETSGA